MKLLTHKHYNDALSYLVIALSLYAMAWPLLPAANWWLQHSLPVVGHPAVNSPIRISTPPSTNTLYIPKLEMQQEIFDGASEYTVNKGVWRRPATATPDQHDNTVLVGHRFTYKGQGVFYFLDKLTVGDSISVFWQGKQYDYKVRVVEIVSPNNLQVEAHTSNSQLTIYTCTPLWTSKQRLVVIADLVSVS